MSLLAPTLFLPLWETISDALRLGSPTASPFFLCQYPELLVKDLRSVRVMSSELIVSKPPLQENLSAALPVCPLKVEFRACLLFSPILLGNAEGFSALRRYLGPLTD